MKTPSKTTVIYPSARDLDAPLRDYSIDLYLIPAEESSSGEVEIETHNGVGNIGWPVRAHNGRWFSLGSVPAGAVGQSVLDALKGQEAHWLELASRYLGTEWDGHNHIGRWMEDEDGGYDPVIDNLFADVAIKEDAGDALDGAGWGDLCRKYGIDPERGRDAMAELAAAIEATAAADGYHLDGLERFLEDQLEDWADED